MFTMGYVQIDCVMTSLTSLSTNFHELINLFDLKKIFLNSLKYPFMSCHENKRPGEEEETMILICNVLKECGRKQMNSSYAWLILQW